MSVQEQQTIKKAVAGDRMAFRALVLEHSEAMFRLAWRISCDESLADDIVQEAFIKAWRKLDTFKMESSFRTWLHRITVNTAMEFLRKKSRRGKFEVETPDYDSGQHPAYSPNPGDQIDIRAQTEAAMRKLSEIERSALVLRHFEGHSISEIGQILQLNTSASKQAVFRAVKKLRIALEPLVTT